MEVEVLDEPPSTPILANMRATLKFPILKFVWCGGFGVCFRTKSVYEVFRRQSTAHFHVLAAPHLRL